MHFHFAIVSKQQRPPFTFVFSTLQCVLKKINKWIKIKGAVMGSSHLWHHKGRQRPTSPTWCLFARYVAAFLQTSCFDPFPKCVEDKTQHRFQQENKSRCCVFFQEAVNRWLNVLYCAFFSFPALLNFSCKSDSLENWIKNKDRKMGPINSQTAGWKKHGGSESNNRIICKIYSI